jgi:hypothetical protein
MTDDEATALGKRLVACKGFRPMRGMLDMQGRTWDASLLWRWNSAVDVPDLRDPATIGCVLALVREAHDEVGLVPILMGDGEWQVLFHGGHVVGTCEAAALVAALEAAP